MSSDPPNPEPPPDPEPPGPALGLYALIGLGTLNLASLLVGLGIGWYLDGQFDSFPAGTLIGLALGIGAGITVSWFQIRKYFHDAT